MRHMRVTYESSKEDKLLGTCLHRPEPFSHNFCVYSADQLWGRGELLYINMDAFICLSKCKWKRKGKALIKTMH